MSLNLHDFDDIMLAGMTAFERWRGEFEAQFIQADAEQMIQQVLQSMTPQQLAQLQQADPAAYKSLADRFMKAR